MPNGQTILRMGIGNSEAFYEICSKNKIENERKKNENKRLSIALTNAMYSSVLVMSSSFCCCIRSVWTISLILWTFLIYARRSDHNSLCVSRLATKRKWLAANRINPNRTHNSEWSNTWMQRFRKLIEMQTESHSECHVTERMSHSSLSTHVVLIRAVRHLHCCVRRVAAHRCAHLCQTQLSAHVASMQTTFGR